MHGVKVLNNLLLPSLFQELRPENNLFVAHLKETGVDSKLKDVKIHNIACGSVLLKTDECEPPNNLFNAGKGECRRCDYVLITKVSGKKLILFIEMKSGIAKINEISKQFKGTECLLDYCDAALDRFHGQNSLLATFEKRFIVFYKVRVHKTPTRAGGARAGNTSPDKPCMYGNPENPSISEFV